MSAESLRSRLLFALTAGTALGLSACVCGDYEPEVTETTEDFTGYLNNGEDPCPEDPYNEGSWYVEVPRCDPEPGEDSGDVVEVRLYGQDGSECRYEVYCVDVEPDNCIGGRPIEQGGCAVLAAAVRRADWRTTKAPALEGLDESERQELAERWTRAALEEHSSVAGFNKLALGLLALGAPPELLLAAQQAAIEEIHHARDAFALASTYAGRPVGPGPLALQPIQPARDLVELALATAREGAINETLSAWDAQRRLETETDPAVQATLARVVDEETRHAELAWRILGWAVAVGGHPVRAALTRLFSELTVPPSLQPCIEQVLRPVADQLLAA